MRFLQITSKRTFWAKKVISSRGHSHGCHLRFPASQFTVLFYNFPTVEQCGHHHFIWTFSNYPSFSSREIIYQKKTCSKKCQLPCQFYFNKYLTESLLCEFRNPRRLWRIFEYQGNPCLPQPGGCGVQIIGV